jgi:hypothetical protein
MRNDPFQGIDFSTLSDADRAVIEKLRSIYRDEGKDALVRALLTDLAKNNSTLFMWLLGVVLD